MKISEILAPASVVAELGAQNKIEALKELIAALTAAHPTVNQDDYLSILIERERLGSTGVGDGVAIPHGKIRSGKSVQAAFGRSSAGLQFDSIDDRPTHLFFLLMAPESAAGTHLKALAKISRMLKSEQTRAALLGAEDAAQIYKILTTED